MKKKNVIEIFKGVLDAFDTSAYKKEKRRIEALSIPDQQKTSKKITNVKNNLQETLKEDLKKAFENTYPELIWGEEYPLTGNGRKDRADIYAPDLRKHDEIRNSHDWEIIIEIDTARADQVGKKFVSRFAHILKSPTKNIVYMVLCYPSKNSDENECRKYIGYGEELLKNITSQKTHGKTFFFSAFVVDDKDNLKIEKSSQFSATPSSAQV